jgi:hypothetical protein
MAVALEKIGLEEITDMTGSKLNKMLPRPQGGST